RKHAVGVFSLEMSRQQLVQRLLAAKSGVNSQKIRRSMLNSDDYHKLHIACGELMDAQILIDDTPGLTPLQLRAKARRMVGKHDIKAIFIDYLQLMAVGGRVESRQVEISEISRSVKAMARELNVPVICLSQLNRAPEQREGHRPRMSDLRESGSLEQDADVIMMLHREDYYHQGEDDWADRNPDKLGLAELIITKQRNGPTGTVKLTWASQITRFRDYSPAAPSYGYDDGPSSGSHGGHFTPGSRKGPVQNFRDGGGPERDEVDDLPI
ncbi:MAG: replicative DNA helicase, partial [Planctomycetota bacterium]|nr:replicative DNA helicase [Planctomycetota bacterium]